MRTICAASSLGNRALRPALLIAATVVFIFAGAFGFWVLSIPLIASAVLAIGYRKKLMASLRWRGACLELPNRDLLLGDELSAIYRRAPRQARSLGTYSVRATLVCEEEVQYRRGSDTQTERERVYSSTVSGDTGGIVANDGPAGIAASLSVRLPTGAGAPSIELGNNQISWYLEVVTTGAEMPADVQSFPIVVHPELATMPQDDRTDS